jgi:PAS domain S-box-containing protein
MEAEGADSAAEAIQASTEQLLDSAPDAVVIIDRVGVILLVNRQAESLFGYRREELLGRSIEQLVPDRVRDGHPRHRDAYFTRPSTRPMGAGLQLSARRKDGSEFPVDISLSSLETRDGLVVLAAVRDITERKRGEAKFEGLLEAAPDAIVAVDERGLIHLVNRQAEALFGFTRDELIGQPLDRLVPDRVRPAHPTHRASYFTNPTPRPMGAGLELSARRKDGSEFPVDISLSSLETEDGVLVSAAVRDVTDRKRIEEERAELEARLVQAQREEERAQLEAQLHQAQRLESVGQLAGGIAHDFNNLLAGIMNYAGLVSATLEDFAEERGLRNDPMLAMVAHDVGEITHVAKRAAALTHQLLIFSRREVVQAEILDLNAVLAELEKLLRRTIGEDIDFRTQLAPDLPAIKADRGQIEQVLMNLAVNARDAMPSGGSLTIQTGAVEIDDEYERTDALLPGPYVRLTVSDTGVGMAADVVERAFEPFFTTKAEGSGLGLATVYGIVRQTGGEVVIYSEPSLGTTIRVHVPVTHEQERRAAPKGAEPSAGSQGETILLVEDEEIVREPARRMLERRGYRVLAAASAEETISLLTGLGEHIDLLLTDVIMPGLSGKDLVERLLPQRPDLKVLYMSGYSQDVIVHQGIIETGVHLIEKPFSADALISRVREVLDG